MLNFSNTSLAFSHHHDKPLFHPYYTKLNLLHFLGTSSCSAISDAAIGKANRLLIVRCQAKVHNYKCSYLLWNFIALLLKILSFIEFYFIISRIFLIFYLLEISMIWAISLLARDIFYLFSCTLFGLYLIKCYICNIR